MNLKASIIALAGLGLLVCPCSIRAVQFGQIDDFQDGTTQNWENGGGGPPVLNLDGGPAGPGDLFMQISSIGGGGPGGRLTVFNRAQWLGDYIGEGITVIEVDLNNSGGTQLSIRIAFKQQVGPSAPGYVSQPFIIPAGSGWQHATFSITPGTMTPINGPLGFSTFFSGNFEEARIINSINPNLNGDPIVAELGIDNIHATVAIASISGTVTYCTGTPRPVPDVTLNLSGDIVASTATDNAGVYTLAAIPNGGNYTVTPSKGDLPPGGINTAGIDTADASAVQRHFLGQSLLSGCALQASRASPDNTGAGPDTRDANAIQRFYLGLNGTGNAGQWRFNPNNRMYQPLSGNQVGQNYDTYVLGDVTGDLVFPGSAPMPMDVSALAGVATVTLPIMAVPSSAGNFSALVSASNIDAGEKLIAFQGDFSFDSSVVSFQNPPVARAGLTARGNWALAANVLGTGKIKTLRVSCFALDADSVLAGEGPLFELRLSRVSGKPGASTALVWSAEPNNFIFIDENAKRRALGSTPPGKLTWTRPTGKR